MEGSSSSISNSNKHLMLDSSLDIKNGKGENIGWLALEPSQSINLYTVPEGSSLTARWKERKPGLLDKIKGKEKEFDKRIVGWSEQKRSGVLPWAISRLAEKHDEEPFGVEHIRGGNLNAGQKVLQTYVW